MANLSGRGAPTDQTVGVAGDIYTNEDSGVKYKCTGKFSISAYGNDRTTYCWSVIPEGGIANGEIVRSNWNQNDSAEPDYIINRPFWEDDPIETVLFSGTLVASETEPTLIEPLDLVAGRNYTIIFDGVEYIVTAVGRTGTVFIGFDAAVGYSEGMPPFIFANAGMFASVIPGSHDVTIVTTHSEIHKIDGKYLPSSVLQAPTSGYEVYPIHANKLLGDVFHTVPSMFLSGENHYETDYSPKKWELIKFLCNKPGVILDVSSEPALSRFGMNNDVITAEARVLWTHNYSNSGDVHVTTVSVTLTKDETLGKIYCDSVMWQNRITGEFVTLA